MRLSLIINPTEVAVKIPPPSLYRYTLLTGLLALLGGCSSAPSDNVSSAAGLLDLRGVVQQRGGQLYFQPCFARGWWPLQDATEENRLSSFYGRLGQGSLPVYMEFSATQANADNQVTVARLSIAGGSESTCFFDLSNLDFRAASISPYWVADIVDNGITVQSADPLGRYSFSVLREELRDEHDGAVEYITNTIGPEQTDFSMLITPGACVDQSNGTLLNYNASMLLFGNRYKGCARLGEQQSIPDGFFRYQQHDLEALMKLQADGRVSLVRRFDGQTITERGRWQMLESGKLLLSMLDIRGQEFLLSFDRLNRAEFSLQAGRLDNLASGSKFRLWQQSPLVWRGERRQVVQPAGASLPADGSSPETVAEQQTQYSQQIRTLDFQTVEVQANELPVKEIELLHQD